MQNGSYDVATGPFFMNCKYLDYGPIIYKDRFIFAIKRMKEEAHEVYLTAFNDIVWNFWIVCFITSILCFYTLHILLEKPNKLSVLEAVLSIFKINIGGGLENTPKSSSLRLFMAFYLFASLILCSIYLGRISSILTADEFLKINIVRLYNIFKSNLHYKYSPYMDHILDITVISKRRVTGKSNITEYYVKTNGTEWEILKNVSISSKKIYRFIL